MNNTYLDGRAFDVNAIAVAAPNCDDFCAQIVSPKGQTKGLGGNIGWSMDDDQWCANHAVGTNPTVVATSTTANTTTSCNVPMLSGDSSCAEVNRKLTQCKLKGSQIETRCAAYVSSREASKSEKITLGFDVAATTACGAACAGQFFGLGATLIVACKAAGAAATGNELIQIFKARNSMVQRYINVGSAAAGAVVTAIGIQGGIKASSKAESCTAAAVFGAMTGLRARNIKSQSDTKKKACDQVKELIQNSLAAGFNPLATGGGAGTATADAGNSSSSSGQVNTAGGIGLSGMTSADAGGAGDTETSSSSSGTALSLGSSTASTAVTNRGAPGFLGYGGGFDDYKKCLSDPSCTNDAFNGNNKNNAAALDGGLLKDSGLMSALTPKVQAMDLDKMVDDIERGGSVGGLIGGALGGSNGAALGGIASAAEADAPNLGIAGVSDGVGTTPGSTGPSLGVAQAQGQDPFAGLAAGAQPVGAADQAAFGGEGNPFQGVIGACDARDIYHSNCRGTTIFEIVSDKINRSRGRVENLNYALPMNRALANQ